MKKQKFSHYFSIGTNAFAWQCAILAALNIFLGNPFAVSSYAVLQFLCVGFTIALLMFFTDKLTASSGLPLKIFIDLIDVGSVVLVLGGVVFKWFSFTLFDLLIVAGVILAVYIIVFSVMMLREKIESEKINEKIREMNGDENSN